MSGYQASRQCSGLVITINPCKECEMVLSICGTKMASPSGLRSIMEDIATTVTDPSDDQWLNLSIGNPAPIPEVIAMWQRFTEEAVADSFNVASCQYGPSRGAKPLLYALTDYFNAKYAWGITADNIVVGPGSQMLCFVAAALFAGPMTDGMKQIVLPTVPDYTGYQGLNMHVGGIVGIPPKIHLEEARYFRYTLDIEALERQRHIGMILMSSPSNPTGRSVSQEELDAIVALAEARNIPVLIDQAYGLPFPQIAAAQMPPIWHPNVINCFSMSKAGLPGERIGFALGSKPYMDAMTAFISNATLHAPQLAQMVLTRAIESGELDRVTTSVIKPYYAKKRGFAEQLLCEIYPDAVQWRLHSSQGGMFCWLWIDHPRFDDEEFYRLLKQRKLFIVPGRHFFVDPLCLGEHSTRCFRLSLSADEATIWKGIERIAEALEELHCEVPY